MRGIFWGFIFLLGLALFLPGSQSWARPVVSDVRIGQHTDKTRFVLELSEDPAYRIFTLADPFRVVIDLPELEWSEREGWSAGKGMISALWSFYPRYQSGGVGRDPAHGGESGLCPAAQ